MSGEPGHAGMMVEQPRVGVTDVDVIGGDGSYIAVGGPGKAANPTKVRKTLDKLDILKFAADRAGVPAYAYFAKGTPQFLLDKAEEVMGVGYVRVFE